jgi:hypothetical protein
MSQPFQSLPRWALVLAIVGFCLFVGGYCVGRDLAHRDAAAAAPH